jgi:hypothetical protein
MVTVLVLTRVNVLQHKQKPLKEAGRNNIYSGLSMCLATTAGLKLSFQHYTISICIDILDKDFILEFATVKEK